MWGDVFYNIETKTFTKKSDNGLNPRSFVHFILEPFYKLLGFTISNEKTELMPFLKTIGVYLRKSDFLLDIKPLLKLVMQKVFGDLRCFIDSIVEYCPSA